mgnify:CR=1 FL=1
MAGSRAQQRLAKAASAALRAHLAGSPLRLPEAARIVWPIFLGLHGTRLMNEAGPQAITFAEIEAYAQLQRWPLLPHHVDLIRALDRAWLDHARGAPATPTVTAGPGQNINPRAFDAVFG